MGIAVGLLGACDGGESCPPDYPIARDGYCYRADGGEAAPMDASIPDDAATDVDGGGGGDEDGGGGVICTGTHPILDGTRRYCEAGDCFCADPDNCFPSEIAASCCDVAVVCGDEDAGTSPGSDGGGVICTGTHPLLDAGRRYCEAGDCFCADPDNCFPAEIAEACCSVGVVCE